MNTITPKQAKAKWFNGLDSIRFILAFIVVLSHIDNPFALALKNSTALPLQWIGRGLSISFVGVAAVIAFFIISGFVIHYPHLSGMSSVRKFYIRRFLRLGIPMLVIHLVSIRLGGPDAAVNWSLVCEMIFYLLYPLMRTYIKSWRMLFVITYVGSFVCMYLAAPGEFQSLLQQQNVQYDGNYWHLGFSLTWVVGLPCWLLGVMIAAQIDRVTTVPSTAGIWSFRALLTVISIACCYLRFHQFVSYLITMNLMAPLMYFWLRDEIQYYKYHASIPLLEKWGKFSYSVYLIHPTLFVVLELWMPLNMATYFLYLGTVLGVSWLFYQAVEKPSHQLAQRLSRMELPTALKRGKAVKPAAVEQLSPQES